MQDSPLALWIQNVPSTFAPSKLAPTWLRSILPGLDLLGLDPIQLVRRGQLHSDWLHSLASSNLLVAQIRLNHLCYGQVSMTQISTLWFAPSGALKLPHLELARVRFAFVKSAPFGSAITSLA